MKKMITLFAVLGLVLALAPTAQAAAVALTGANVTYDNADVGPGIVSIDGLNFNIEAPSSLSVTIYNKNLTIKVTGVNEAIYGVEAGATHGSGNPTEAQQDYISNSTVNECWSFGNDTSEPYNGTFEATLTTSMTATDAGELNDVALILFEASGNDYPTIQAHNGTSLIGTPLTLTVGDWGDTGATTYGRSASGDTSAAVGLSLSDLGVTIGQTVTKFVFTAVNNWDITEIMVNGNLTVAGATTTTAAATTTTAAATTTMPWSIALLTALSILACVMLTPRLIFMMSTLSSTARFIALMIKSDGTDSPSDETLYEKISTLGAIPIS